VSADADAFHGVCEPDVCAFCFLFVMAGLAPAIHVFFLQKKNVDARLRGHDDKRRKDAMLRMRSWLPNGG
jgi:hypothetical protein